MYSDSGDSDIEPENERVKDNPENYPNFSKKLVCINYPGNVNNVDKMLDTLGGMSIVENTVVSARRNLELRFRPEDYYSKPCVSDRSIEPSILLKLKIRRPNPGGPSTSSSTANNQPQIVSHEVLGISAVAYSFNKLCDFQYLPLVVKSGEETSESRLEYIHDVIIPKDLPDFKWFENDITKNTPLFLPPAIFSKHDNYTGNMLHFDRSSFYDGRFKAEYASKFRAMEQKRKSAKAPHESFRTNAIMIRYEDDIPPAPTQEILNAVHSKLNIPGLMASLEKLKKYFADRPISSKTCLDFHVRLPKEHYKILLAYVAYYYLTGPWRVMWVRIGYDPRKDACNRIYQTFDFRIRAAIGLKRFIKAKRNYIQAKEEAATLSSTIDAAALKPSNNEIYNEDTYLLRPGLIPSARQLFYQYCDIQLPEIQAMLGRLPNVLPDVRCHPKDGWLPRGFSDQCREIVSRYVDAEMNRTARQPSTSATTQELPDDTVDKEAALQEISDSSSSEELSDDEPENKEESDTEMDADEFEEINKLIDLDSVQL